MQFGEDPVRTRLIPLTPLIDVVFILLVFFMLASSFSDWRALDLKIAAQGGATSSGPPALVVDLAPGGDLRLNGRTLSESELAAQIETELERTPERSVLVRPAEAVSLQQTIDLLDLLKQAGADAIALAEAR